MRETRPLALAATNALLGAGIGLLLSERIGNARRMAIGGALAALGALGTLTVVAAVMIRRRRIEALTTWRPPPPVH
jgi:hypothetical protein